MYFTQSKQRAAASPPQEQAESDKDGHPARVKKKGAAAEPKKNGGLE